MKINLPGFAATALLQAICEKIDIKHLTNTSVPESIKSDQILVQDERPRITLLKEVYSLFCIRHSLIFSSQHFLRIFAHLPSAVGSRLL